MKYDYLFFDLDGTLTDSGQGIINSVVYSLEKSGERNIDNKVLRAFIGPPLVDCYMKYFGYTKQKAQTALVYYREYFAEKGIFENRLYPGVADMLKKLKAAGKTVIVATCKPEQYSARIIDHFGLSPYVDLLAGATMDEKRNDKTAVIKYALGLVKPPLEKTLMIGDRDCDITGAHANGIKAAGVLYGYGGKQELETAGADYIAADVNELERFLLSQ